MGIEFMQENEIKFSRTEGGILALEYLGEKYPDIILQRAFPLSKPFEYISVKTSAIHKDMSNELGIIRDVSKLSEENRNIVKEELAQRYFVPVITRIESLKDEFGQIYMDVDTSAGKKKIAVPNSSANFVKLGENRLLLIDFDGNRYEIPEISTLDKKSMRYLEVVI